VSRRRRTARPGTAASRRPPSGERRGARGPAATHASLQKAGASAQCPERRLRRAEGGEPCSFAAGLTGRRTNSPPQFGHRPPARRVRAQSAHHVHSKEQIIASRLSGGRSRPQHSQSGLSSSIFASPGGRSSARVRSLRRASRRCRRP
jgi:hypothetical protein